MGPFTIADAVLTKGSTTASANAKGTVSALAHLRSVVESSRTCSARRRESRRSQRPARCRERAPGVRL